MMITTTAAVTRLITREDAQFFKCQRSRDRHRNCWSSSEKKSDLYVICSVNRNWTVSGWNWMEEKQQTGWIAGIRIDQEKKKSKEGRSRAGDSILWREKIWPKFSEFSYKQNKHGGGCPLYIYILHRIQWWWFLLDWLARRTFDERVSRRWW